ncbi:hypothetical protein OROGR_025098 [Orobanche gracilis]
MQNLFPVGPFSSTRLLVATDKTTLHRRREDRVNQSDSGKANLV